MYFTNCKTLDELKAEYRRLAMANHPDCGGDVDTMKKINADHDAAFEILKKRHNESADEFHQTTETAEEFRDIIEALLKLDGRLSFAAAGFGSAGTPASTRKRSRRRAAAGASRNRCGIGDTPRTGAATTGASPPCPTSA